VFFTVSVIGHRATAFSGASLPLLEGPFEGMFFKKWFLILVYEGRKVIAELTS